jgi:hypothetical protein
MFCMVQQTRQSMLDPIDYNGASRTRPLSVEQRDNPTPAGAVSTSREENDRERNRIVKYMVHDLRLIVHGASVAHRVVSVIDGLQRGADYGMITVEQREHLLRLLSAARAYVLSLFHAPDARAHALTGLDAVGALIFVWGETANQIKARPPNTYAILHDEAEILRCACQIRVCSDNLALLANEHTGALARIN